MKLGAGVAAWHASLLSASSERSWDLLPRWARASKQDRYPRRGCSPRSTRLAAWPVLQWADTEAKGPAWRECREKSRQFDSRKKFKWKKKSIYNSVI